MGLYWEILVGAVEPNEKNKEAAIWELHEELGIIVEEAELSSLFLRRRIDSSPVYVF